MPLSVYGDVQAAHSLTTTFLGPVIDNGRQPSGPRPDRRLRPSSIPKPDWYTDFWRRAAGFNGSFAVSSKRAVSGGNSPEPRPNRAQTHETLFNWGGRVSYRPVAVVQRSKPLLHGLR